MKSKLDDRRVELMTILNEECGEVVQASSKLLRFGESKHFQELEKELGDLQCMIDLCVEFGYATRGGVREGSKSKRRKLNQFSNLFTAIDNVGINYESMKQ